MTNINQNKDGSFSFDFGEKNVTVLSIFVTTDKGHVLADCITGKTYEIPQGQSGGYHRRGKGNIT